MVACSQCSVPNSLDSHFCKGCGAALAVEDLSVAQQKVHDLVADGYRIFNEGRTDEARLIAETTLHDEPNSSSALSLRGMCHERAGELALALECFEKVVELNPDSPLDKIKVTHLRQAITGRSLAEAPHRRGTAFATAAAAVVFVVAVGIAIATSGSTDGRVAAKNETVVKSAFDTAPFTKQDLTTQQKSAAAQTDVNKPADPAPNGTGVQPGPGPSTPPPVVNRSGPSWMTPLGNGSRGGTLPSVGNNDLEGPIGGPRPITPNITITPIGPNNDPKDDPDPVMGGGNPIGPNNSGVKPADDPGIIEITVSKPKQPAGGSQIAPEGNGAEALLKTANQQFLLGRHSQAAGTFEAALRAGAPAGSTNQRLGQCYANIGNKEMAATCYRRAINAYEAGIARGGDTSRLQSALDSCKQALKVLGG